jgi:hypothetical protein
LGLGSALRRLAESRARCLVHLADGAQHEAVVLRVGQDFVEVESPAGARLLVAFDGIAAVQSR